jgi:hypothetical protein
VNQPGFTSISLDAAVHLAVGAGRASAAFQTFLYRQQGMALEPRDGLLKSAKRMSLAQRRIPEAAFLGRANWDHKRGTIVLAPPFDLAQSLYADHVIFRWRKDGRDYVVSLHAWEPFTQAYETLHRMVNTLPG